MHILTQRTKMTQAEIADFVLGEIAETQHAFAGGAFGPENLQRLRKIA